LSRTSGPNRYRLNISECFSNTACLLVPWIAAGSVQGIMKCGCHFQATIHWCYDTVAAEDSWLFRYVDFDMYVLRECFLVSTLKSLDRIANYSELLFRSCSVSCR